MLGKISLQRGLEEDPDGEEVADKTEGGHGREQNSLGDEAEHVVVVVVLHRRVLNRVEKQVLNMVLFSSHSSVDPSAAMVRIPSKNLYLFSILILIFKGRKYKMRPGSDHIYKITLLISTRV